VKEIASGRIDILVRHARKEKNFDLADKQAAIAKKIAMRVRLRLPYNHRQLFCKKCKQLIIPGRTSRVRIGRSNTRAIRITCLRCGHTYRKLLGKTTKSRNSATIPETQ
jgi:ribonuclease P protein subunit RPR2